MTITTRVFMLMSCALIGFGQGYQPVCSFNYGAGLRGRVKEGYWFCVKWGTVFLTCIATVCFIFAPQVIALFLKNKNPDAIAVGTVALRCQACVLPLSAFIVMSNMMLQSIGKGVKATITASARNGLCFIPMILLLPKLFGLTGVEISQTVADVLALFVTVPLALSEIRKWKEEIVPSE
jgi:Na+-driven multidrug efflux pump